MTLLVSSSLLTQKTVSPVHVAAAVAEVKNAGVAEANVRSLVDAFVVASRDDRVSAPSRKAFETALFALVQQLPHTPSAVMVRRDEASLTSGIKNTKTVIAKQTERVVGLEAEVQDLSLALADKKAESAQLLATQQSLQQELATAKDAEKAALNKNFMLSLFPLAKILSAVVVVNAVQNIRSIGQL